MFAARRDCSVQSLREWKSPNRKNAYGAGNSTIFGNEAQGLFQMNSHLQLTSTFEYTELLLDGFFFPGWYDPFVSRMRELPFRNRGIAARERCQASAQDELRRQSIFIQPSYTHSNT
jgi:hypothetical protein